MGRMEVHSRVTEKDEIRIGELQVLAEKCDLC